MLSFVKLRIVSPIIHWFRFRWFALRRLLSSSRGVVQTKHGPIVYFAPNAKSFMRTVTVYSKEPETIAWIDSFDDGDALWDIGANIGIYTIYAAARPAAHVVAFEPSPANFAVLCRSVELNRMDDRVSAYCLALDNRKQLSRFNMKTTEAGFAGSALNTRRSVTGKDFVPAFSQATLGYTIDDFIAEFEPPFPNHLKIDVDGNDHLVLAGAARTLADGRLKSVLVELVGGERAAKGAEALRAAGFTLDPASEGARGNRIYRRQ
jgi:FkbM family methyltransferase